jgi:hypothetical protein
MNRTLGNAATAAVVLLISTGSARAQELTHTTKRDGKQAKPKAGSGQPTGPPERSQGIGEGTGAPR